MPPKPPLSALAIPPDAVCVSKLVHSFPDEEAVVRVLDGVPNLILADLTVWLRDSARVSLERPDCNFFSEEPVTGVVAGVLGGRTLGEPGKLFLDFATLTFHPPRLFQHQNRVRCFRFHRMKTFCPKLLPVPELLQIVQTLGCNYRLRTLQRENSTSRPDCSRVFGRLLVRPRAVSTSNQTARPAGIASPRGWR